MPYIKVTFPSSSKEYIFEISEEDYYKVKIGSNYFITDENGYNYRNSKVTIVDKKFKFKDFAPYNVKKIKITPCDTKELDRNTDITSSTSNSDIATQVTYGESFTSHLTDSIVTDRKTVFNLGDVELNLDGLTVNGKEAKFYIFDNDKNVEIERGGKSMNKIFGNFEFGKYSGNALKLSMNGISYKTKEGKYVSYDAKNNTITDVTDFTLDIDGMIYLMPVAQKDIKIGDVIKSSGNFVIVSDILETSIEVVAPDTNEVKVILPVKNLFGFNFFTKAFSLLGDNLFGNIDKENPFGNILPFLMLSNKDEKGSDFEKILLMNMMSGKNSVDFSNPLFTLLFCKNDGNDSLFPLMMMNMMNKNNEKE